MTTRTEPQATAARAAEAFPLPAFLTEAQVAERLAISPRTLQMWRFRGGGPEFVKVGALVRYEPEAVAAWLARHTRASTSDPGPEAA